MPDLQKVRFLIVTKARDRERTAEPRPEILKARIKKLRAVTQPPTKHGMDNEVLQGLCPEASNAVGNHADS